MTIDEARLEDTGTYTLCAKNLAGIAYTSCDVFVDTPLGQDSSMVAEPEAKMPVVLSQLKDIATIEGGSVQLDCVISSFPEPGEDQQVAPKPTRRASSFGSVGPLS